MLFEREVRQAFADAIDRAHTVRSIAERVPMFDPLGLWGTDAEFIAELERLFQQRPYCSNMHVTPIPMYTASNTGD